LLLIAKIGQGQAGQAQDLPLQTKFNIQCSMFFCFFKANRSNKEMTKMQHMIQDNKYYTLRSLPQFHISVILACPESFFRC